MHYEKLGDFPCIVTLKGAYPAPNNGPGYQQSGQVFVERGTRLHYGDRLYYADTLFQVISIVRADYDHPFTGADFGWVSHAIERIV